jgi:hypothetical protein
VEWLSGRKRTGARFIVNTDFAPIWPIEMRRFETGQPELFGDIIRAETEG